MSTRKTLFCYIIGDESREMFSVKIGAQDSVEELKVTILALKFNRFNHIEATDLHLWAVSIPLDDGFSRMSEVPEDAQELTQPWVDIGTLFRNVRRKHLYVLIEVPPRFFILECHIVGDEPRRTFPLGINRTEDVEALRDAIKAQESGKLKNVSPRHLDLWAVTIPINEVFSENVANFPFEDQKPLQLKERLSQVFRAPFAINRIQVLVRIQSAEIIPWLESVLTTRSKLYSNFDQHSRSTLAKMTEFGEFQNTDKYYACCRTSEREPDLVLTLLDPVFATFFEESQAAVLTREDYEAARSLRDTMCEFYDDEKQRASALREELLQYGIETAAGKIGNSDCKTDGHIQCNNRPVFILKVQDELGLGGADPSIQVVVCYDLFCAKYRLWTETWSYHPCFIMFFFGSFLGIGGCALTGRPVQEIFAVLPLNFPQSDNRAYDTLARHLSALKTGVKLLSAQYERQPSPPKPVSPPLQDHRYVFPYQTAFTSLVGSDTGQKVEFSYSGAIKGNNLISTAKSIKGPLLIKLVQRYGKEVHDFCTRLGFAPTLFGFEVLSGGWFMVVMEHLDATWVRLNYKETLQEGLKDRVKSAIAQLHGGGFVHGDVRNTNVMVKETGGLDFMLVDFDWAGRAGKVNYLNPDPMIGRPAAAQDCTPILAEHDDHMFNYLFRHRFSLTSAVGDKNKV